MRINEATALVNEKVVLRPYRRSHVVKYHEWMADEAIRQATASEILTLEQEYEMQASWRLDDDSKYWTVLLPIYQLNLSFAELTFIVHRRKENCSIDSPSFLDFHDTTAMIGDVNLFLSEEIHESEDLEDTEVASYPNGSFPRTASQTRRAEVEVMIAESGARRQGYALSALRVLLSYASSALGLPPSAFFARIGASNEGSIALFEKLGFKKGKLVAVFDEQQMDWGGGADWGWPRDSFEELNDPAETLLT